MSTGLTLQRDLCFIEVIEGETDAYQRLSIESAFLSLVERAGVRLQSAEISGSGCYVTIPAHQVAAFKTAVTTFNAAVRVRERCARIVAHAALCELRPSLPALMTAFWEEGLTIVHVAVNEAEIAITVDSSHVHAAMAVLSRLCTGRRRGVAA